MLIRGAELGGQIRDVRVTSALIADIRPALQPYDGERIIEANGNALLPGLHDHHIHLNAAAAALLSVRCGPPEVNSADHLAAVLHAAPGEGWIRGVGYHPSIGVDLDRDWLDAMGPRRPMRIQHRGGRMWVVNSLAAEILGEQVPRDGRLIDQDGWIRERLNGAVDLQPLAYKLASYGVTGVTDTTPRNGLADYHRYVAARLPQRLIVMGGAEIDMAPATDKVSRGAVKLHYHDHDLPGLDALAAEIARAHGVGRPVAAHCVTLAELMLTLAAIEQAGSMDGDRIEHAGIALPHCAEWMAHLGVTVVTQPHFISERGDAYRREVDAEMQPWLYRLKGLLHAGVRLAAGSDAPFGGLNPWASMAAAVTRSAPFSAEQLSADEALGLYTGKGHAPGDGARSIAPGATADLCLIDRRWEAAQRDLGDVHVQATIAGGEVIFETGITPSQ